jgi:hypothetical protein
MRLESQHAAEGTKQMDMRKYTGTSFIKFDEVKSRPMVETIHEVVEGKYDKANLKFESGRQFSLNATNCRVLAKAYGQDSNEWLGCEIELYAGKLEYNGSENDAVLVRPISTTKNQNPAQPKAEPDFDDQIPF